MKNNTKKNKTKNKGLKTKYLFKKTNKYYGGNYNEKMMDTSFENETNKTNEINKIKNQIEEENSQNNHLYSTDYGSSDVLNKASELAQNIGAKAIDSLSNSLGLDLTNSEEVNEKLKRVNETLSDPRNVEQVKEIISNAAEMGALGIEAAKPFVTPLIDTTIEKTKEAASKIGEAGVKIALNTATEIPGIGVVVGTIRSLSNAGEAGLATLNAGNEIIKTTANTINASSKNFNRLMKEKQKLLNRTQNSINDFMDPLKYNNYDNYKRDYIPNHYASQRMTMRRGGIRNRSVRKRQK